MRDYTAIKGSVFFENSYLAIQNVHARSKNAVGDMALCHSDRYVGINVIIFKR